MVAQARARCASVLELENMKLPAVQPGEYTVASLV